MSRAKKTAQTSAPAFVVRAARGHMIRPGSVAFSGTLWKGDEMIGEFRNYGDGGCNVWKVYAGQAALFEEFKAAAVREFPDSQFEHEDHLVGKLWDAAMLKAAA